MEVRSAGCMERRADHVSLLLHAIRQASPTDELLMNDAIYGCNDPGDRLKVDAGVTGQVADQPARRVVESSGSSLPLSPSHDAQLSSTRPDSTNPTIHPNDHSISGQDSRESLWLTPPKANEQRQIR